ncbi:MAG: phosphotransferase, partial [Kiritimatiellae bacterium]|nr:phosphotransferase [Kiritimatiellia bacterium]
DSASGFSFEIPWLAPPRGGEDPAPLLRLWESAETEPAEKNGLFRDVAPFLPDSARRRLSTVSLRKAFVHGDFAPWNWRRGGDGALACVDWEWARDDGFAGFDMAYCVVQRLVLVRKTPPERLRDAFAAAAAALPGPQREILSGSGLAAGDLLDLVLAYRKMKNMEEPAAGRPRRRPAFVAFEGADGVGKSTVMRLLVPELAKRGGFRGYAFFHWKPVAGGMSFDSVPGDDPHDPRAKSPRSAAASLAYLAYHWLGFVAGYFRHVRPALKAGRLVVADRYAYDVLLDPARFRLRVPRALLRAFVRAVPKPDAAILLHAPAATIRARKPELSESEIEAYQGALLGCDLVKGKVPAEASVPPESIVAGILENPLFG